MEMFTYPSDLVLPDLDDKQKIAVECLRLNGDVVIEACPGSGKTFLGVFLGLCANRFGWTTPNRPALFLTFSRNSRVQIEQEMTKYVRNNWMSRKEANTIEVQNYHSFFYSHISNRKGYWGIDHLRVIMNDLIDENSIKKNRGSNSEVHPNITDPYTFNFNNLADWDCSGRYSANMEKLLKAGLIRYDDMAPLFLDFIKNNPHYADYLRSKHPLILLDEFQDTDGLQLRILDLINPNHVVVLFDRYQMIYDFRGSSEPNIERWLEAKGFDVSFRTTLETIHRAPKDKNIPYFIQNLRYDCLLGSKITESMTDGWLDSRCILQEKTNGKPMHLKILNNVIDLLLHSGDFETTAILTRDNVSANFLYNNLLKDSRLNRRLLFRKIGRTGGTEEIFRKLIYQLSLINDNAELRSWIGCFFQQVIPKKYSDFLNIDFQSEFKKDPKIMFSKRRKSEFIQLREKWEKILPNVSLERIDTIAGGLDYALGLGKQLTKKWGPVDVDVSYFAHSVVNSLKRFNSADATGSYLLLVCEHLENELLAVARANIERHPKGVYVTTIHQSKGREFDNVIIPWLSDKRTKVFNYRFDHKIFEDRKLLYVACTRATQKVTIFFPEDNPSNFIPQWKLH